ncbi:MAG: lipopolysaccharide heptosyltransferase II [Verrucomicrobiales bacterium]|nr:lipopolysaccharide heptosyltransferase II [Verrucomicrobiales bacterium]
MKKAAVAPFQFVGYLFFRLAEWSVGLFPLKSCMNFGSSAGMLIYRHSSHYRNLVRRNLTIAYETKKSSEEIEELTKKHFRKLGANLMASARTSLMNREEISEIVTYEGVDCFQRGLAAGKGVIGALTHTANWELYARISPLPEDNPFGTIYQGLRNPFINRHIEKRRGALGTHLFERRRGFAGPTQFLRDGGALGVLLDQFPGERGIWAPFFGRLTATTTLPALLSLRTGAPIMFVGMYPDGEAKWKIRFHEPIFPPQNKEDKDEWTRNVTVELNQKLTETVAENPEEWFWVHNRFKTCGPDLFPHLKKFEIALPSGVSVEELKPHYFLIRSPNPLGDACMSIPAVRAVKKGRPDAHVTILCRENLEPLWRQQPEVDDIITMPGRVKPSIVGDLIKSRRPYYDTAILFPNSTSSAFEARAGGVPMRYGYKGHHRKRLLRWVIPEPPSDPPTHHLERYLNIVRELGADVSNRDELLKLPPAPTPITTGQTDWRICLCPGAEFGEAKRWPLERYAASIELLRSKHPDHTIHASVVGSPAEAGLGEQLVEKIEEPKENLAGRTSVDGLVEHLKTCHIVVSNDTGTMHLAAALGIPTVAIFGSTEPVLTSPIGEIHRVIREKVECSPCFKRDCPIDFPCMTGISVERVVTEIEALMQK